MKPQTFTLRAMVYPARHYLPGGAAIKEYTVVVRITERHSDRDGRLQEAKMIGRSAVANLYAKDHAHKSEDQNFVVEMKEHPAPWDQEFPKGGNDNTSVWVLFEAG
ncbi:MAG TPA: hypothetical protein VG796_07010 [Verrucomicrobiales bacterium]|nr:hypothetical protein [Verrucomicrobiales bacterium]